MEAAQTDIDLTGNGGVMKRILRAGTGSAPPKGSTVSVHYVGTLLDGKQFDSSRDRGSPFEFKLGTGSVIKGWDIGVATMVEGELAVLTCTAEYAYGESGSPPTIPPNATLRFEVELLSFDAEDADDSTAGRLASAAAKKDQGNEAVRQGEYGKAEALYRKAAEKIEYLYGITDAEKAEKTTLEGQLQSNLALCYLKLAHRLAGWPVT